eukprot:gnl/MRDRNA2_/MRDRNA2_86779_c0_seq11.p1 gnl/MRDRNA2_/MRDRNA2_86779_c0~~gnl/MRDRNA2_/MRDRNA2_86779_c0_seq11.p1  ORF type:complete len:153 (+),score=18.15 gnl/MRDRNA2_/MRDRNA2_86779_c0_seq11:691-1149(+)
MEDDPLLEAISAPSRRIIADEITRETPLDHSTERAAPSEDAWPWGNPYAAEASSFSSVEGRTQPLPPPPPPPPPPPGEMSTSPEPGPAASYWAKRELEAVVSSKQQYLDFSDRRQRLKRTASWKCTHCGQTNFPNRSICHNRACGRRRGDNS